MPPAPRTNFQEWIGLAQGLSPLALLLGAGSFSGGEARLSLALWGVELHPWSPTPSMPRAPPVWQPQMTADIILGGRMAPVKNLYARQTTSNLYQLWEIDWAGPQFSNLINWADLIKWFHEALNTVSSATESCPLGGWDVLGHWPWGISWPFSITYLWVHLFRLKEGLF